MHIHMFSYLFLFANIYQLSARIKELKAELEELEKLKDKDYPTVGRGTGSTILLLEIAGLIWII